MRNLDILAPGWRNARGPRSGLQAVLSLASDNWRSRAGYMLDLYALSSRAYGAFGAKRKTPRFTRRKHDPEAL